MYTYIIPCYNSAMTIERAIKSIIDDENLKEIICVDDKSSDDTLDILLVLQKRYPKIKILKNAQNQGAGYSRNIAIKEADSEYIAFLDSDDTIKNHLNLDIMGDEDFIYISSKTIKHKTEIMPAAWNFVVKKDFLIEHNIFFHDTLYFEDLYFSCLLFNYTANYKCVQYDYYDYIVRKNSYSTIKTQRIYELFDLIEELETRQVDSKILEYTYQIHVAYFLKIRALLQQDIDRIDDIAKFLKNRKFEKFSNISPTMKIKMLILQLPKKILVILFKIIGSMR